jgi:tetratricopeptide (TPR) repeat protein
MAPNAQCRYCSSPTDKNERHRLFFLFDARAALDIALGEVTAPCRVCGGQDGLQPTTLAVSVRAHEIFCLDRGDVPKILAAIQSGFSETFNIIGLGPFPIWKTSELHTFQTRVSDCVRTSASLFPYLGHPDANLDAEICDVWRGLQGEVQTAVLTCSAGAVPGTRLGLVDQSLETASFDQTLQNLKQWSSNALVRLPLWFKSLNQSRVPFEEVLFRLVDTSPFSVDIASSVIAIYETLRHKIEHISGRSDKIIFNFQLDALQASLCRSAGINNDREEQWAHAFLAKEVANQSGTQLSDILSNLKLSTKRLSQTISRGTAWDAAGSFLASTLEAHNDYNATERIRAATELMGHPGLVEELFRRGIVIGAAPEAVEYSPEEVADRIVSVAWGGDFPGASVSATLDLSTRGLSWGNDPEKLDGLIDALLAHASTDIEKRADVLCWCGRRMKELDQPRRALERMGHGPADWEEHLELTSRLCLWTERSNALRLAGDLKSALSIAVSVRDLAAESGSTASCATAMVNVGILERECGFLDGAIGTLAEAALLFPERQRADALQSLGIALSEAGRDAEAAKQFGDARLLVGKSSHHDQYAALLMAEAGARLNANQAKEATALLLREYADVDTIPSSAIATYASLFEQISEPEDAQDIHMAQKLVARLVRMHDEYVKSDNLLRASQSIGAAAQVASTFRFQIEDSLWLHEVMLSTASKLIVRPIAALEVWRIAILEGNEKESHEGLSRLLVSLAQSFGWLDVRAQSLKALTPLRRHFNRLIGACLRKNKPISLIQTIAEVRRNAHNRAVNIRQTITTGAASGPVALGSPEKIVLSIAAGLEPFLVLEWIEADDRTAMFATLLDADRAHRFDLQPPLIDLRRLSEMIECRIAGWHNGRQGEPHLVDGWDHLVCWLRDIVAAKLPPGKHVVIVDHRHFVGIPFHIALAPAWTCSYASGWSAILGATQDRAIPHEVRQGGLIYVPRENESDATLAAFQRSVLRQREFFRARQISLHEKILEEADAAAFNEILSRADAMKIMCHGQISRTDAEVALLLAHDGRLPPGHAYAASTEAGRQHRLGGAQLSAVRSRATIAFVGACSSGHVQVHGLDERIGLFALLQSGGVRTMVAPRWKIDVELAMPVLDQALEIYIEGTPLAIAVARAADAAIARGVPIWQARAFAIEGGWV